MIKKMLVPLDDSSLSYKVLDTALTMANAFGSEVVLLRIQKEAAKLDVEDQQDTKVELNIVERETKELMAFAEKWAAEDGHSVDFDKVTAEVRSGPVVQIIAETSKELHADLVVMGTHGRHGLVEQLTGSSTEQIVAKIPASVFVVKPSGFPYLRD